MDLMDPIMDPNYGSHGSKMWIPWIPKIDHIALKYESKKWIQWIQDGNPMDQKCGSSGSHGSKMWIPWIQNLTPWIQNLFPLDQKCGYSLSKKWIRWIQNVDQKYGSKLWIQIDD